MGFTSQLLLPPGGLAKYFRPQFTVVSVIPTTSFNAVVIRVHLELAPQPAVPPFPQVSPIASSRIEPDRSRTISNSGGGAMTVNG
jgi:hypothetical protein